MKKTRIMIVDDHPIVRHGLADLIDNEPDLVVCAEARSPEEALEKFSSSKPDLAIVDVLLKGEDGIDLVKELKRIDPQLFVLVLSMLDEYSYAEKALRAGASGYMMKTQASNDVVKAIHQILRGETYLSEEMSSKIIGDFKKGKGKTKGESEPSIVDLLSNRELQVFRMIGSGLGTNAIAEKLFLSVKTIETYRQGIKEKLGFKTSTELAQRATLWTQSEAS